MRLIKDELEVARAAARDRRDPARLRRRRPRAAHGAQTEREVEGVFNLRARVEGNDVGYGTIAACGPNACISALDAQRRRARPRRAAAARRRRRGATRSTPPTSPARCPSAAVHARAARDLRARASRRRTRPSRGARRATTSWSPTAPRCACSPQAWSGSASCPVGRGGAEATRTSSTSATRCTTSATCSGLDVHDCAQARAGDLQVRQAAGRAWCSPSSRGSTSSPTI